MASLANCGYGLSLISYLTNRLQYVSINNYKSGLLQVKSGVPQGSILGPLLFIIYVNDLSSVINNSHILGYADDTKCYKHMVTQFDQQFLLSLSLLCF